MMMTMYGMVICGREDVELLMACEDLPKDALGELTIRVSNRVETDGI
jgi:hypothetical protein